MRLVTYDSNGEWHAGIFIDEKVVDASVAAKAADISFDGDELIKPRHYSIKSR